MYNVDNSTEVVLCDGVLSYQVPWGSPSSQLQVWGENSDSEWYKKI